MAQITNISNSANSTPMPLLATPSDEDEDVDDHHQFLTPSSIFNSPTKNNGVAYPQTVLTSNNNNSYFVKIHDAPDSIPPALTADTTISNAPKLHTYVNLSTSGSEISLDEPLLIGNNRKLPNFSSSLNIQGERKTTTSSTTTTTSSSSSTTASTSSTSSNHLNSSLCGSYIALYFTDMLISAFIITPLVNIHWRGAWDLLDIHLLPDYPAMSALISLGIGYAMLYMMYLAQNRLQKFYETHQHDIMGRIMTRLYTLLLAFAYIHQWRGLWNLLDLTSSQWYHLSAEAGVSMIFLFLMKSIYNLNSAPFIIGVDTESYFLLDSKYSLTSNRFLQQTFDFFYYEVVEAPLLVLAWHGLYSLSDLYIYPDHRQLSMLVSFASGYLLYFILVLIQIPVVRCLIKQRRESLHPFVSDLFHFLAFLSVVQIWRSLWIICEQYLNIPEYHNTTLWLCYGLAFVVLTCGLAACSLNGPGGSKDSYINDRPILIFTFDYFSSLLKRQSNHLKEISEGSSSTADTSSTEVLMPDKRPYLFKPP